MSWKSKRVGHVAWINGLMWVPPCSLLWAWPIKEWALSSSSYPPPHSLVHQCPSVLKVVLWSIMSNIDIFHHFFLSIDIWTEKENRTVLIKKFEPWWSKNKTVVIKIFIYILSIHLIYNRRHFLWMIYKISLI